MNEITTIGLDMAKNIFHVHGVDADGAVVLSKRLRPEVPEGLLICRPNQRGSSAQDRCLAPENL